MSRSIFSFWLLFLAWLLWSGHFDDPLLIGLGIASSALVVWISFRMGLLQGEEPSRYVMLRLLGYVPWVLWQVVVTNFQAAAVILAPSLPIYPHLLSLRVKQRTTLGKVIHANTITLTPGTVTLDVRGDTFLIHALTRRAGRLESGGVLDTKVARLEGR